jgi:putative intracellular protease/amidase
MEPIKLLIIATSHDHMGNTSRKTGSWLEELAIPYLLFREAGALITLGSPKGGEVPLDPKSESIIASNGMIRRFQKDPEACSWLAGSLHLNTVRAKDYDLVYLAGGHGPMWDFAVNEVLTRLLEDFDRQHKLIGAVSHGLAGLLLAQNTLGQPLVKGRKLTACSNTEEQVMGLTEIMPFLLQSSLEALGALYGKGPDFNGHCVTDGNLITGQNAASVKDVTKKMLTGLKEMPKLAEAVAY